jgi:hypothetical protein
LAPTTNAGSVNLTSAANYVYWSKKTDWAKTTVDTSAPAYFIRIRNTATATTAGVLVAGAANFTRALRDDNSLQPVSGGVGYMQASRDNVETFIWVDTGTKHGILCFGRKVTGHSWYGPYPMYSGLDEDSAQTIYCEDYLAPTGGNGYHSDQDAACLYLHDPAQLIEVANGTRHGNANGAGTLPGINADDSVNWHTLWPNIPSTVEDQAWISAKQGNGGFFDARTNQVLWVHPQTVGAGNYPTLQIFQVT